MTTQREPLDAGGAGCLILIAIGAVAVGLIALLLGMVTR